MPGNFLLLDYGSNHFPDIRYIHIIRNGLDMAFSENSNQLKNWGFYFGIEASSSPVSMLKYWIDANKYAISKGRTLLWDKFHLLNYDSLITNSKEVNEELCSFLGVYDLDIGELSKIVKKTNSSERYKKNDISLFSQSDLDELTNLGFHL